MSFPATKRKSTFTNVITGLTAMLIKPNRVRIGGAGAEGSGHGSKIRKGTKTYVSLALIVTIVAFKLLPDLSCERVLARMAEVKCLIFSPRPTPLGTCRNATNGATNLGCSPRETPTNGVSLINRIGTARGGVDLACEDSGPQLAGFYLRASMYQA